MNSERDDDTIERARREIRAQAEHLRERPLLPRRPPNTDSSRTRERNDHPRILAIGELTDRHHLAFVEHAFRMLLGRAPDRAEAEAQLARLARGASKAELIGDLRWSSEGRAADVHVAGLRVRYLLAKARRIPLLGYALEWMLALIALPLQSRHQRAVESWVAARDHGAAEASDALAARAGSLELHLRALADATAARHAEVGRNLVSLQSAADALAGRLQDAERALARLGGLAESSRLRLDELEDLRRRLHGVKRWTEALQCAIADIEAEDKERKSKSYPLASRIADSVMVGNESREARLREWLALLIDGAPKDANALVLASGGDWRALIAARGWPVTADSECDDKPGSPRAILDRTETGSVYAVTALALPTLATVLSLTELLPEIVRVLRTDGVVLFAFAREPNELRAALLGRTTVDLEIDTVQAALRIVGFDCRRADAADGVPALIGSRVV